MLIDAHGRKTYALERKAVPLDKLKRFMEFEQILRDNHWAMVCRTCANFIAGDNDPSGTRVSVKCSCKELVFDAGTN